MKILRRLEITYGEKNNRLAGSTDISEGWSFPDQEQPCPVFPLPRFQASQSSSLRTASPSFHFHTRTLASKRETASPPTQRTDSAGRGLLGRLVQLPHFTGKEMGAQRGTLS